MTGRIPLVAVCLAYFMVILDTTIVNVALPVLSADLHADVSALQWVVDGYLLVLAAVLLGGGALADRLGARRVFQLGLALFVAASVACGAAPGIAALVGARLVQGLGAALAVPASLALLRAAYPEPHARAKAIGIWGGIAGVAAATGPLLGGVLVTALSWRLVFFVNVPIGVAAMAIAACRVPAPQGRPRALDPAAQACAVLSLGGLTFALIEGGRAGWTLSVILGAAVAAGALAALVAIERAASSPMLPLAMLRERAFAGGNGIGLLINLGFYGQLFVINLYFQRVWHFSALLAGLALLPQMGVVALGSALSGRLTSRTGSTVPTLLAGLLCGAAGLLGLVPALATGAYPALLAPLVAVGFGMSFTMPAATTAVVEGAPEDRAGLASGAVNASRQVGSVIGVALLGALVGGGGGMRPGLDVALAIAGASFLAGAAVTVGAMRPGGRSDRRRLERAGMPR